MRVMRLRGYLPRSSRALYTVPGALSCTPSLPVSSMVGAALDELSVGDTRDAPPAVGI